jgi:GT2 family glycosyltransferase
MGRIKGIFNARAGLISRAAKSSDPGAGLEPIRLLDVELTAGVPAVPRDSDGDGSYRRARTFVRLHNRPLGIVELELAASGLTAADHARSLWAALGPQIVEHLRADGLPGVEALGPHGLPAEEVPSCLDDRRSFLERAPFASVVIVTRDRPESLADCLATLLRLEYPHYEIVVVDNAPSSPATRELVLQTHGHLPQVHYVREDRPGTGSARNRGLREASGSIVAFTDDDIEVDRFWLLELAMSFEHTDDVACVTGLIAPAELKTPAQLLLERCWRMNKGLSTRVFSLGNDQSMDPLYPYAAGSFGSGANMAFKASILRELGGFDEALGTGTRARGGEDLAAFLDVIAAGYTLVYQPRAIVWHKHAPEYADVANKVFDYGTGLTAYLMKALVDRPGRIVDFALRAPRAFRYGLSPNSPKNNTRQPHFPAELSRAERIGMLYGPFAYVFSRWAHKRHRRRRGDRNGEATAARLTRPAGHRAHLH